jgi:leucyl aminopeptidase
VIDADVPTTVVVDDRSALDVGATVVAVPVWPGEGGAGPWVGEGAAELHTLGMDLFEALERDGASGRAGQVVSVPVSGAGGLERALLVGIGDGSAAMYRRAGAAVARSARGVRRLASTVSATASDGEVRAFVEGAVLAPLCAAQTRGSGGAAARARARLDRFRTPGRGRSRPSRRPRRLARP